MIELTFKGGDELVKLMIDRKNKKLKVASSKTNYQLIERPWTDLFDKGQEEKQDKATSALNDYLFKHLISHHMNKIGYVLMNK